MTSGVCPLCGTEQGEFPIGDGPFSLRQREVFKYACDACLHYGMVGDHQLVDDLCDGVIRETVPRIVAIVGESPWTAWLPFRHGDRFDDDEMLELLRLGGRLPPMETIRGVYGGWGNVVGVAGYADVPPPSSRGIRSTANDGHACFSQGERLLDDWFGANGVEHSREPIYPGSRFRGDFLIRRQIVEFFGMAGDAAYDVRMGAKAQAAAAAGISVVGVYPDDLAPTNWPATQQRLSETLGFEIITRKATPRSTTSIDLVSEPLGAVVPPWSGAPTYDVEPGFYPDPYEVDGLRWNDGSAWTYRVLIDGVPSSHTLGVPGSERRWVASTLHYSDRLGQPTIAGRNWIEDVENVILDAQIAQNPEPDPKTIRALVAWLDLTDNSQWPTSFDDAYRLALRYFGAHRMRGSEVAVHERYAAQFHVPLEPLSFDVNSVLALRSRGHQADLVESTLAFRGKPPTPKSAESNDGLDVLDEYWTQAVAFLSAIGVTSTSDTRSPGSAVHLSADDALVHLQIGPSVDIDGLRRFAQTNASDDLVRLSFCAGDAGEEVRDFATDHAIGLFQFDPPGRPRPLNWDAGEYFDEHSDDTSLIDPDPDFFMNN